MDKDKFIAVLEFLKWFIGSVALVWAIKIVDAGFQDREINIKEFSQYDKYMSYITTSDKIGERIAIAEFYKTVSLSVPVRDRWTAYYDLIKPQYEKFIVEHSAITDSINLLSAKPVLNLMEEKKLIEFKTKNEFLAEQIIPSSSLTSPSPTSDQAAASYFETKAFDDLTNSDIRSAANNFEKANKLYPSFHNAEEIRILLDSKVDSFELGSPLEKHSILKNISTKILRDYSWKLKPEQKVALELLKKEKI